MLAVNLLIAKTHMGARNWIEIGGFTVQPSEFVKIAFIFVGSATLEKIQTSKNIIAFIAFSMAVVGSLIIIKDLGTALIFFVTFLILAFMNSGDIKTVVLAVATAVMGGAIVLKYKSYVARRFAVYRHIWEADNFNNSGYQQTRVLVGMASGGLLGLGIGNGNIRYIGESTNDLIFGVICEEWGYIFGIIVVLSFVCIAISALVNSIGRTQHFLLNRLHCGGRNAPVSDGAEYFRYYRHSSAYGRYASVHQSGRLEYDFVLDGARLYQGVGCAYL